MFYSFTGGEEQASYESPEGLIEGLVYLKRNLVIRKQILQRKTTVALHFRVVGVFGERVGI